MSDEWKPDVPDWWREEYRSSNEMHPPTESLSSVEKESNVDHIYGLAAIAIFSYVAAYSVTGYWWLAVGIALLCAAVIAMATRSESEVVSSTPQAAPKRPFTSTLGTGPG
jgi:hypothetical protein